MVELKRKWDKVMMHTTNLKAFAKSKWTTAKYLCNLQASTRMERSSCGVHYSRKYLQHKLFGQKCSDVNSLLLSATNVAWEQRCVDLANTWCEGNWPKSGGISGIILCIRLANRLDTPNLPLGWDTWCRQTFFVEMVERKDKGRAVLQNTIGDLIYGTRRWTAPAFGDS